MKASNKNMVMTLTMLLCTALLAGCDDVQKYLERMKLNEEEVAKVRPIFEEHAKRQNQILEKIKNQRPFSKTPGGSGGLAMGGGMGGSSGRKRPDRSQMKEMMEKKKAEMSEKFEENDNFAIRELEKFLTAEQLEEFKTITKEIRQEKMKEIMSQPQGPRGSRGGRGGMGKPGRGMGGF